jgi:hypothetical protein
MSRTAFASLVHKTPGVRFIVGTFQEKVGADPDILLGAGWSVARTAAGKYTVTFDQTFPRCIALLTDIGESGDNKDFASHHDEIDLTTTCSSVIIRTCVGSTGVDTETEDQQVSFLAIMADTSIVTQRSS